MKKLVLGLVFICILVVMTFVSMYCIDRYYESKINGRYCDSVGDSLRVEKNQGIMLQEMSLERKDNIQIYGSSELGTGIIPSNPAHLFQINFIGRGYCQSLVHAMNIEALNKNLKDKKVVILISPQWFNKNGLTPAALNMNFSELQFYSIMFNKRITKDMKIYIAKRLDYLLSETADFKNERIFASLYSSDNIFSKALLGTLIPYYKFRCYTFDYSDAFEPLNLLYRAIQSESWSHIHFKMNPL
jgi:D-alanine transfer protein